MASNGQLKAIIERIERAKEEVKEAQEGVKEIYAEAKAHGFDAKVIRELIKRRATDPSKLAEFEELLVMYENAVQLPLPLGD
jgi:uncharacterized protein (UPF0335 family)